MSGPMAEGGPLPPVDHDLLAAHERRIAEWETEIAARVDEPGPLGVTGQAEVRVARQHTERDNQA